MAGWEWVKAAPRPGAAPGAAWEQTPWADGEWLGPPLHQVFALPPGGGAGEVLGVVLNEVADGAWAFRRNRQIRRPAGAEGLRAHGGIPVMAPEIVLAYKAKDLRPKDQHDFAVSAPLLDAGRRAWLERTLALCHPGHPWLACLHPGGGTRAGVAPRGARQRGRRQEPPPCAGRATAAPPAPGDSVEDRQLSAAA